MLKLLERNVESVEERLVLIAPPQATIHPAFNRVQTDADARRRTIRDLQRLRGGIYFRDGAIGREQLTAGGRHATPEDDKSWHLVFTNDAGRVTACVWYMEHENTTALDRLRVRNCPLAQSDDWRGTLRLAVESELARARHAGLRYAEVGGWAVAEDCRCKSEGLLLALAAYSLGRISGGALGMTTATVRHSSSTILRRLGGTDLMAGDVTIPSYWDPKYKCEMELLRFDSRRPDPKYAPLIARLSRKLADVCLLTEAVPVEAHEPVSATPSLAPAIAAAA